MEFKHFRDKIESKFNEMAKHDLFVMDVERDMVWEAYMDSFPAGTNEMMRERREHDCNTCKSFVRRVGNVVAIIDNEIVSVWDIDADGYYKDVAVNMAGFIRSYGIKDIFLHNEQKVGQFQTESICEDGTIERWNHFSCTLPAKVVSQDVAATKGKVRQNVQVFKRGLDELTIEALDIVADLIAQSSIYRGEEFADTVNDFILLKTGYDKIQDSEHKDMYAWQNVRKRSSLIRNTAIGTLIQDLSEGKSIDIAVKSFETKVAPTNYKRTSSPVTKGMIAQAVQKINDLGLEPYLHRRYARLADISINNVIFADRSSSVLMKDSLTDMLMSEVKENPKKFDGIEEIGIEDFILDVVPKAESIEVLFDNKHTGNLVSLIAPEVEGGEQLFKWANPFSWSYNGEITDSMREQVIAKGGRVDGVLRFTHSWNHTGQNQSLMDLHVFFPGSKHADGINDNYSSGRRVGWNKRNDKLSGGSQDIDFTSPPGKSVPLENITFPDMDKLPEGTYTFKIHNWSFRSPTTTGFKAEIEAGGEIHTYSYDKPMKNKEWITVATAVLKDGVFTFDHKLSTSTESRRVWKLDTQKFQKVSALMFSPNYWDDQTSGNKHYFFMLDKCENPDETRGIYNEFLRNDLTEHRKVFEVLADKMKCDHTTDQLSGLGFSSTKRDEIICKVNGSFTRMMKVRF